ncbi:MAG: hypothetical protein QME25_05970 [Bacteroidota bacterium]|nr:hypothetical protein [Bacteroidota bacterium]
MFTDELIILLELNHWEKWSPWHEKDPKMVIVYERPTAGSGAIYKWDSKNPEVG